MLQVHEINTVGDLFIRVYERIYIEAFQSAYCLEYNKYFEFKQVVRV